jgi:hypothetical protein
MRSGWTWVSLAGAFLPVAYCVALIWYFVDLGGWDNPILSEQLKPTIVGLGLVGLFFTAWLGFKIWRAFGAGAPPQSGGGAPRAAFASEGAVPEADPDTDAMIARYLAMRTADGAPKSAPSVQPGPARGSATFGRRKL